MEPNNEGLEDDFPFQTGDFHFPAVHFPGCNYSLGLKLKLPSPEYPGN